MADARTEDPAAPQPQPRPRPRLSGTYPALDFVMRHVDYQPNMSHTRGLDELQKQVNDTVISLLVVGEFAAATRLLDLLVQHGIDPWEGPDAKTFLLPAMYFCWHETSSWPDWVPGPERTGARLAELEVAGREPWLERFTPPWAVDRETADRALEMAARGINKVFPPGVVGAYNKIRLVRESFERGMYGYAADPTGFFAARYLAMNMWWRTGTYPAPWMQVYRSAGLTIALDVLLRLDGEEAAEEADYVLGQICDRITFVEQAEMLVCSRAAWQKRLFMRRSDGGGVGGGGSPVLRMMDVDPAQAHAGALRAVELLERRLASGPARPYRDMTIAELAEIVSANSFENGAYRELARVAGPAGRLEAPDGLLRLPACSAADLEALEARLGDIELPGDYKELLAATDGMGPIWDGGFLLRLFAPAAEVRFVPLDVLEGQELSLLLPRPSAAGASVKWPAMPGQALALGGAEAGGPRGDLWLIDRATTASCKEAFFAVFDASEGGERRRLERDVEEVYGSVERLRGLDRALVGWASWQLDVTPYDGARGLLEILAEKSLHKMRLWDNCFDPGLQETLNLGDPWYMAWEV